MNIFRLLGDLAHLASFFLLLHRLRERKSAVGEPPSARRRARCCYHLVRARCAAARRLSAPFFGGPPRSPAGISLKTQELYLLVFCTRYLDLFTNFHRCAPL